MNLIFFSKHKVEADCFYRSEERRSHFLWTWDCSSELLSWSIEWDLPLQLFPRAIKTSSFLWVQAHRVWSQTLFLHRWWRKNDHRNAPSSEIDWVRTFIVFDHFFTTYHHLPVHYCAFLPIFTLLSSIFVLFFILNDKLLFRKILSFNRFSADLGTSTKACQKFFINCSSEEDDFLLFFFLFGRWSGWKGGLGWWMHGGNPPIGRSNALALLAGR